MTVRFAAGLLICGFVSMGRGTAQGMDANLAREVAGVRSELARNGVALRQYTWTEHTEVLVKGDVKSTSAATCRYGDDGKIVKTPVEGGQPNETPSATAKRLKNRKKSEMQDYIERAIGMIQTYVPPKPEQIDYLLQNGLATLGKTSGGESEIRLRDYYQRGDSLAFIYDPTTKRLLRATIASNLGSPKDPVTMDAVFETLPDGVNHLASTVVNAKAKKVEIKSRNVMYKQLTN